MDIFSVPHLLLMLVIVVLLFGTKKIGNIGSDLGNAVRGFKKAMHGDDEDDKAKAAAQAKEQLRADPPPSTSSQGQHDSHESK